MSEKTPPLWGYLSIPAFAVALLALKSQGIRGYDAVGYIAIGVVVVAVLLAFRKR